MIHNGNKSFQCMNGSNQSTRGPKSQIQIGASPPPLRWRWTKTWSRPQWSKNTHDLPRSLRNDLQWQQHDSSAQIDTINPREDQKAKFRVGHHFCNAAGGEPRLEVVKKNAKKTDLQWSLNTNPQWQQHDFSGWIDLTNQGKDHKAKFGVGHHLCHGARLEATKQNQKSPDLPLSLCNDPQSQPCNFNPWMDPTNPREDCRAKVAVGRHLRHGAGGWQRLEASQKSPKSHVLPWSLHNDLLWQQHCFKPWMDPTNPREDHEAKFGVTHHLHHGAGGWPRLENVPKNAKTTRFAVVIQNPSTLATTIFQCMNGSSQPKRVPKSKIQSGASPPPLRWRWTTTQSRAEWSKNTHDLPWSLCNDLQWQQHDSSAQIDTTSPREEQLAKFGVGHHLCHGTGGEPSLEVIQENQNNCWFAVVIVQWSTMAKMSFQCMNGSDQPNGGPKSQIQSGASPPPLGWRWTKTGSCREKSKNDPICNGHCATIHNGDNMISVHEWIQPTQERTKKPNSEWGTASAMELEVTNPKMTWFASVVVQWLNKFFSTNTLWATTFFDDTSACKWHQQRQWMATLCLVSIPQVLPLGINLLGCCVCAVHWFFFFFWKHFCCCESFRFVIRDLFLGSQMAPGGVVTRTA